MKSMMRRLAIFSALGMVSVLLAFGPVSAHAAESRVFRLANGLSVAVREDARFPLVAVRLFVKAGAAWERPDEAGTSHLLEHMVFKGSKTREEGVDRMVEDAGGRLNASTDYDVTIYQTDLPAAQWKTAMTAVRDLAFDPVLRPSDLNAEREVVLAEKKQRGDSPYTRLFHMLFGDAFRGTPYESPIIGTEEALRAATPESMRAYIERRYDPRDMVLAVAGDVKIEDVLAEAESLFGAYPNRNRAEMPVPIAPADLTHGLQVQLVEGPWNKVYLGMVFPLPGLGDARRAAADMLAHMLAGDETALLPRRLRIENPLTDAVMASALFYERLGAFVIMAQLDADKVHPFLKEFAGILATLKASDFTAREFDRAKLNLENDFVRGQESIASQADYAGNLLFYSPGDPNGEAYVQSVRGVSREQVQSVIDDWLRPEALTLGALLPQDAGVTAKSVHQALQEWPGVKEGIQKATAWEKQQKIARGKGSPQGNAQDVGEDVPRLTPPDVIDLGSGRTLVLLPDASLPYVSASLLFSGGDTLLASLPGAPADKEGLAALSADMLASATKSKNYAQMNAFLADRASSLAASGGGLTFGLNVDAPARFDQDIFALLREVLTEPAFAQSDLERVQREMLASLASEKESTMGLMSQNLMPFLFPGSVYGLHTKGTQESIARLTRADAEAFWALQRQQPWVLAVAGDFDRKEVLAFAKSLPAPSARRSEGIAPAWNDEHTLDLSLPGRDQAVFAMLFPTQELSGQDSAALRLLAASLDGFGGLLFQELREKRSLCYSVSPMNWPGEHAGFLAFIISAGPENLEESRREFEKIARKLQQEALPAATLERAKASLEAGYYRSQQRLTARSAKAANHVLFGRPVDYPLLCLDEIKALTPEDIQTVAKRYLDPTRAYALTVKP